MKRFLVCLLPAAIFALTGCAPTSSPTLETPADSLAYQLTEAAGGLKAFNALPTLAFEWTVERDSAIVSHAMHLWDKKGDRYRVEWEVGIDSIMVASFKPSVFVPDAPAGSAALNGEALAGDALAEALSTAYSKHINDSFWLLAPLKVLDQGARRSLAPDSGASVLHVTYVDVGLTPGDQYWMHADASGAVTSWSYLLGGGSEGTWAWSEPEDIPTPAGPLRLATSKRKADGSVIRVVPQSVAMDASLFKNLMPTFLGM